MRAPCVTIKQVPFINNIAKLRVRKAGCPTRRWSICADSPKIVVHMLLNRDFAKEMFVVIVYRSG